MLFLYASPNGVTNELDNTMRFYVENSSTDDESRCQLIASTEGKRIVLHSGKRAEVNHELGRVRAVFRIPPVIDIED